jgi:hypothetical protein
VNTDELHERLDATFEAISPRPAPVDEAIRRGTAIRKRRRSAVAGAVAMLAVAGVLGVPALHRVLSSGPAPAPVSPSRSYTVTVQPAGPGAQPGLVASGTINGQRWWVLVDRPGVDVATASQQDIIAAGPGVGAIGGTDVYAPVLRATADSGLVAVDGLSTTAAQALVGAVRADVSYVTVALGNGSVLTLHPVPVYGARLVAFAIPANATITEMAAYSRHGELGYAIPFNLSGNAFFGLWLTPGQQPAPRASGVIGSGSWQGHRWSVTAHLGPWGICELVSTNIGGGGCVPAVPAGTLVVPLNQGATPEIEGGVAAPTAVRIEVTQPDGSKDQVPLVTVGGRKLFAFAVRPGRGSLHWAAYDEAGQVIGSE